MIDEASTLHEFVDTALRDGTQVTREWTWCPGDIDVATLNEFTTGSALPSAQLDHQRNPIAASLKFTQQCVGKLISDITRGVRNGTIAVAPPGKIPEVVPNTPKDAGLRILETQCELAMSGMARAVVGQNAMRRFDDFWSDAVIADPIWYEFLDQKNFDSKQEILDLTTHTAKCTI